MEEIRIIASDSVGETAELVTKACTSQFKTKVMHWILLDCLTSK